MKNKSAILVQNTKWIYISKIVTQVLSLVAMVLVIRKLDVDIFGTYNFMLNSFVIFNVFALSAIQNVFNRYIPDLIENREYRKFRIMFYSGFIISSLLCLIIIMILWIYQSTILSVFNVEQFEEYVIPYVLFCFSNFFKIAIETTLRALLLHKRVSIISILNIAIRTILYIALLHRLDVSLLLYIEFWLALLFALQGFYIFIRYNKTLDETAMPLSNKPVTIKRIGKYGLWSMINELGLGIVGKKSDYFIVAAFSNAHSVGIFAFANRIYTMIYKLLPLKEVQTVIRPLFFRKYANEYSIDEFRNMYAFMIKFLLPVYIFPLIYFAFFGKNLIHIVFDPKYADAYWITVIILFGNITTTFFYPLGLTAYLKERMDYLFYGKIVVIFSIIAGIYGMKLFGLLGVAAASVIGNFIKEYFLFLLMRKYPEVRYKFQDYSNFLYFLLLLCPFLFVSFLKLNAYTFFLTSFLFLAYYLLLLILCHPFSKYDLGLLNKITDSSVILKRSKKVFLKYYDQIPRCFFIGKTNHYI